MAHSAVRDFVRVINEIDRSKHHSEVFRDFCEMAYCSLAKVATQTGHPAIPDLWWWQSF